LNFLKQSIYTGLPRASVEYRAELLHGKVFIFLYDLDRKDSRSLTNDAEAVIQDLVRVLPGAKSAVIIYRDPEGCFDFLIPDKDSTDVKFKCIGALSETGAVNWWKKRQQKKNTP